MITGPGQGIGKLRLASKSLRAEVSEAIVGDVSISRTMDGASELSFALSDPDGRIRRSKFLMEATRFSIDDLWFALVKVSKSGPDLTLTAEDRIVHLLRRRKGPKKAFRDKVTRAEFAKSLVREALDKDVKFVSPELHKVQPIKGGKQPGRTKTSKAIDSNRGPGLGPGAKVTVKGVRANRSQLAVISEILDTCAAAKVSSRIMSMCIACATQESNMVNLTRGDYAHPDSKGPFGQWLVPYPKAGKSVAQATRYFLFGSVDGHIGIVAYDKAHPGARFTDAIQAVQRSGHPELYQQWEREARNTVREYLGGSGGAISTTVTTTKRYAFQVGKNENYWDALKRLASEVGWRCFVVKNSVYFIAEPTLLRSRRRMFLSEDSRGVEAIDWDIDSGKKAHTATVTARVRDWAAPPGSVIVMGDHQGPAKGRWLVESIDGTLDGDDVSINLKRPSKPKPEPASETTSRTVGGSQGSSGAGGAAKAVRWARSVVGVTQGSAKYNRWMSAVGGYDPWCSFFVGYIMREVCGLSCSNFAHSSYWLSWSGADRVSVLSIKPGDIVVYDWGDGGETDHVALYVGGGKRIGGNESDAVRENPATLSSAVGIVRPKYR